MLISLLSLLPPNIASAAGSIFGQFIGFLLRGATRRATRQIGMAFPELPHNKHRSICRGMWSNLGRVLAEYAQLHRMLAQEKRQPGRYFDIHDEQGALAHVREGNAVIFACSHFGNWEVLGAISQLSEINVYAFGRPLNNPYVDALLGRFRQRMGLKMLAKGTGKDGVRRLFGALREGSAVGMLVDQAQRGGVHSSFFGRSVRTSPAFVSVAYHLNVPVFPVLVTRLSGCRFRIDILNQLDFPNSGNREADIATVTRRFDSWLESRIRQHPEQWLWLHRRWKTWPMQEEAEAARRARKLPTSNDHR